METGFNNNFINEQRKEMVTQIETLSLILIAMSTKNIEGSWNTHKRKRVEDSGLEKNSGKKNGYKSVKQALNLTYRMSWTKRKSTVPCSQWFYVTIFQL